MTRIEVTTGARLHFGLICSSPSTAWRFGGIGVMLRTPGWRLSVDTSSAIDDTISASPAVALRIQDFLQRIRVSSTVGSLRIEVSGNFPFHTGLGGGTQLGLALAAAVELLHARSLSDNPFRLARLSDRAKRSAIGTAGFAKGGFLIDHGEPANCVMPTKSGEPIPAPSARRLDRLSFPEGWRFILVRPVDSQGLSGVQEQSFFRKRVHMPDELVTDLARQILDEIIPSIADTQFCSFARSLENYGQTVGTFYAAEQGGVFAHSIMTELAVQLRSEGISGMAQSSWGPLIAIPAESPDHAKAITRRIPESIQNCHLIVDVSEPLNTGASIRSIVDDSGARSML